MRGSMVSSPHSKEARQRLYPSNEDESKRRPRTKSKDDDRIFHIARRPNCKYPALKLVLVFIIFGIFFTLLHSPDAYKNNNRSIHQSGSDSQNFVNRWIMSQPDLRYVSDLDINWDQVRMVIKKFPKNDKYIGVGLLNFNKTEIKLWKKLIPNAVHMSLNIAYLKMNVTWDSLYPEWIDEEEEEEIPKCPDVPDVEAPRKRLDLIAVKLPCQKIGNWSKDVARLHLQLATAKLAAYAKGDYPVHILLVTECFPLPNLFRCKDLVERAGNAWLYTPDLNVLREKVHLPVGSCELAVPFRAEGLMNEELFLFTARSLLLKMCPADVKFVETDIVYSGSAHREAYATILHSAHVYVCGAIAAAQSIRMAGSTRDLVILVDETISAYHRSGLEAAGWKVRTIQRIRNPKAEKDAYNEWNYSKFRLWQLTDYDKIIFIDADMLVLRNIDFLFSMPEISATGNNGSLFNSGVMVIEPSNCTFQLLMDHINEIESYNGGDQGYLNEIFTWWHRIPKHMNFLKHFWVGDGEGKKRLKTRLFGAEPPVLYVLHYLGVKPWLCFRDYDCNWNVDFLQEFASDVAHAKWWRVHDAMPDVLQQFCLLRSKQKAQLEWDRRQAEKANYSDEHWKIPVKDRRLKICTDKLCSWKSMLRHWGETNWTDEEFFVLSPPALPKGDLSAL